MAVIRWNPWNISNILDEGIDFPTIPGLSRLSSGLNLYETEDSVIAEAAVPGLTEDQIDITIEEGVVRITGMAEDKSQEKTQRRYFMSSIATTFNYSFRLPEGVIEDHEPKAELHKGVLSLTFTKVAKTPPKKVKVISKDEIKTTKK